MRNSVRVHREALGLSQGELADRIGVSRQTINSIENGRYLPSLPLAFELAREFEVRIEDLFDDEEEQP